MDIHISKEMRERTERVMAQMQAAAREEKQGELMENCFAVVLWFCGTVFVATGLYMYFTL